MKKLPTYSVAIRTLGKAGAVYQTLLDSLSVQIHKPEKILVYLADGYDIPKETIGIEEYVIVPKGMVAQRALDYKETESEYILLLDDDVSLEPNSVKILLEELIAVNGDFIAVDTFHTKERGFKDVLLNFLRNLIYIRKDDGWGVKVCRNSSCSYNNTPSNNVVRTESAAGPASLWKKQSFLDIHFEDEKWLDKFSYALGDDQIMYYKAIVNNHQGYLCYDCGVVHLDARTQQSTFKVDYNRAKHTSMLRFIIWYRSIYKCSNSKLDKMLNIISYLVYFLYMSFIRLITSVVKLTPLSFFKYMQGQYEGIRYIKSNKYKTIPPLKIVK